jgi:hypothetical protein
MVYPDEQHHRGDRTAPVRRGFHRFDEIMPSPIKFPSATVSPPEPLMRDVFLRLTQAAQGLAQGRIDP